MIKGLESMILGLADCPQHDRPQIDLEICDKLRNIVEDGLTSAGLLEILNECIYGSRCSDFAIQAMGQIYTTLKRNNL